MSSIHGGHQSSPEARLRGCLHNVSAIHPARDSERQFWSSSRPVTQHEATEVCSFVDIGDDLAIWMNRSEKIHMHSGGLVQ